MNNLSPRTIEYLEILQEECAEVIQAISKIKRFGTLSYHPNDPQRIPNLEHLVTELGDVQGMIELLCEVDDLPGMTAEMIDACADAKRKKVIKFLRT